MWVLRDLFDYTVVKDILQVSLVQDVKNDWLVWKEDQNGSYSVRWGYHIWRRSHKKYGGENEKDNLSSLWNIKAPTRVKYLVWRICRGCLLTKMRLRQYHVPCPPVCDNNFEDDWHVFFGCS